MQHIELWTLKATFCTMNYPYQAPNSLAVAIDQADDVARGEMKSAMVGQRRLSIANHRAAPLFLQGQPGHDLPRRC